MVLPDVLYRKLAVSYGLQTLRGCLKRGCGAATEFDSEENQHLGEDAGGDGQRRTDTCGRKLLEKELEWHQKKSKGLEEYCEADGAKQNWINRDTKHIETEVEKLEMQANIKTESGPRGNQETPNRAGAVVRH